MTVSTLSAFLVICLVGCGLCQVHLGPVGDPPQDVDCYHCDGHHDDFPDCLNHVHKCHHDEVCKIKYGHGHDEVRCQKAHDCERETARPMRNCTGGGVEVHPGECQRCCADTQCVSDLTNLLKLEAQTSDNLMCPGQCQDDHLSDCIDHSRRCHEGQFCQVTKDDHGRTRGECKPDHEFHHCQEELSRHPCPGGHRCYWDCCTTNDCLMGHFGMFMSTAPTTPAATTPSATTPAATTGPGSLWSNVNGKPCADQLSAGKCQELMVTQDVCHDRLALSICPESCGLCSALNSTVCADTVLDSGCSMLKDTEDVCSDKLAVFVCPQTCNLCDELINSVITSLVEGSSNATDVPPSLLPPSANPSDFPTFDCQDLDSLDCGAIDGLCASSFVQVVCPNKCGACQAPVQTVPSLPNMPTAMPTNDMPTNDMPTTDMPTTDMPTTAMPATAMPTTAMPTTAMPTAAMSTTAMPTTSAPTGTAGTCEDHLNGMDCSQLADVCASVVALTVCPKHCGLC